MPKAERVYFVCHSNDCPDFKASGIRCTVSKAAAGLSPAHYEMVLTNREFCPVYSNPAVMAIVKPKWKHSPYRPGARKRKEIETKETNEIINHPDFLEVT